jgi:dTDP-4-dehydrorhamnose reductase
MKNILIFGSTGMLGAYMKSYLQKNNSFNIITLNRIDYDIYNDDEEKLINILNNYKIDVMINCAGIIKQRNYNIMELIKVNSYFPHLLTNYCEKNNIKFIHISTDCVFNGNTGLYNEESIHDCIDEYGKSKSLGENSKATIIRTSIIGYEKNNKLSLLEWVLKNKNNTIFGFTNHLWNGLTCLELSKYIEQMILNDIFWNGVKHIHSNDINKYDLIKEINDIFDLNITIVAKESYPCYRNLRSIHENKIKILSIQEQLKELKIYDQPC